MSKRTRAILLAASGAMGALFLKVRHMNPSDANTRPTHAAALAPSTAPEECAPGGLELLQSPLPTNKAPGPVGRQRVVPEASSLEVGMFPTDSAEQAETLSEPATDIVVERDHFRHALEGFHQTHHSNGQLESAGRYHNGLREGFWVEWSDSGVKLCEGNYSAGRATGFWTAWHDNGALRAEAYCDKGQFEGACTFWDDHGLAEIARSGEYRAGQRLTH